MVGTTLVEIREYIDTLAAEAGDYYVACGRTGERPVPVAGLRFARRSAARTAARAAEQYRTALRRYDPNVPCYDLIVCQDATPAGAARDRGDRAAVPEQNRDDPEATADRAARTDSGSGTGGAGPPRERRALVEFCHRVAGAVFETLSERGHRAVERAVMGTYFDLAERLPDPDDLCLCLLESMAEALHRRLTPDEQADLLAAAATRLPPADSTDDPLPAALSTLEARGLVGSYSRSPWSVDLVGGTRSVEVRLSEYALAPRRGRLPVLPVVLELRRHRLEWRPSSLSAVELDDGWRLRFVRTEHGEPSGLASAPITTEE
jgi:hypothetical protein